MAQAKAEKPPQSPTSDHETRMPGRWAAAPSLPELLILESVTGIVFVSVIALFGRFVVIVEGSGDNGAFLGIASAIRHWNFQTLVIKAFWGFPYVMAGVSLLTRISDRSALLLVSYVAGFAAVVLAYRLWEGWVAGFFAALNFDWMQRLFLGGSEPLFMALVFGAFLAARRERWLLAALLAAFSTTVRPVGIFALVAIGFALLLKRDFVNFFLATLTGLVVGGLYALPLVLYFRTPLANVQSYQQSDWQGGRLLTWPFSAILKATFSNPAPWTNLGLTWGWILFVLAGFLALVLAKDYRTHWRTRPAEMFFAVSYLVFIYTYNSYWVRGSFPRFAIPILPFVLLALNKWLPKDRRLLWGLAVASSLLAAFSAIGIRTIFYIVRRTIG
jgi:hypothetical protein